MTTHKLFEPLKMGDFELKNRIVLAPMTRGRAGGERIPNELMAEYYHQRASAGLLITEATVVSAQGNGWVGSPGIYTEKIRHPKAQAHRHSHFSAIVALRPGVAQ